MTECDAGDDELVPLALVAETTQRYVEPFVSPLTAIEVLLLEPVRLAPPFVELQLALYAVIDAPPFEGAWKETVTFPFPGVTDGVPGRDGLVAITTFTDGGENGPAGTSRRSPEGRRRTARGGGRSFDGTPGTWARTPDRT